MAIDAIVAGVDFSADIPFPERGIASIKSLIPTLIPIQKIGIFVETLGKVVETEPLVNFLVSQIGLGYEFLRRIIVFLFLPMDCNVSFGQVCLVFHSHPPEEMTVARLIPESLTPVNIGLETRIIRLP